jgi:tRNA nucleotidyltransferase/poly(A) polymerase
MDDPLRVLRCIRFATRFRFKIDADAYSCMSNASIKVSHLIIVRSF